jgi:hypothetical protein
MKSATVYKGDDKWFHLAVDEAKYWRRFLPE